VVEPAVNDPAVMTAADPLIDAFYDETVGSEAYVAHRLHLLEILETKHPLFFHMFGSRAWLEAFLVIPRIDADEETILGLVDLCEPLNLEHLGTTNSLKLLPSGAVEGTDRATTQQLMQLRDYYASLRLPGRPGRPSMDLTTARRAVALSREGTGTREIAQALGISFDPYDPKSVGTALARTRKLVERGGLLDNPDSDQKLGAIKT
jgi:hypothetical protein